MASCIQLYTTTSLQRRDHSSRLDSPQPSVTAFRGSGHLVRFRSRCSSPRGPFFHLTSRSQLGYSPIETMPNDLALPPELLNNIFDCRLSIR